MGRGGRPDACLTADQCESVCVRTKGDACYEEALQRRAAAAQIWERDRLLTIGAEDKERAAMWGMAA